MARAPRQFTIRHPKSGSSPLTLPFQFVASGTTIEDHGQDLVGILSGNAGTVVKGRIIPETRSYHNWRMYFNVPAGVATTEVFDLTIFRASTVTKIIQRRNLFIASTFGVGFSYPTAADTQQCSDCVSPYGYWTPNDTTVTSATLTAVSGGAQTTTDTAPFVDVDSSFWSAVFYSVVPGGYSLSAIGNVSGQATPPTGVNPLTVANC